MDGRRNASDDRTRAPGEPRGVVLVIVCLLVGLLLVMGMTMLNLSFSDFRVASNETRSDQALFNADAGTEEAKMRLSPNAPSGMAISVGTAANWRVYLLSGRTQAEIQAGLDPTYGKAAPNYAAAEGTSNYTFYNSVQSGTNTITWGWARIEHKVNGAGGILYQDAVTGAETTAVSQTVGTDTVYNPPILWVTAEGIQGPVRRMIRTEYQPIVSTTTSTNTVVTDPFANAVHGRGAISFLGNSYTDSYDSRLGAYDVGGNRGSHGDVSTDHTGAGSIALTSNTAIHGNVALGPGGTVGTDLSNGGTITGTVSVGTAAWNLPLSRIPSGVVNQGNLSVSGNSVRTLAEGTYWFSSLSISGNGQLQVTGAVKIYVTGNVSIAGNGVSTAGNLPPNLLIYGTVDPSNAAQRCQQVAISGNGAFYGAVYAPEANLSVSGNGGVYGSLTGNNVTINGNGGFHYDEVLGNLGRFITTSNSTAYTTTGFRRYAWREVGF